VFEPNPLHEWPTVSQCVLTSSPEDTLISISTVHVVTVVIALYITGLNSYSSTYSRIPRGAEFTWHSMFNLVPPVSGDILATLYKRLLINPGFVYQILPGRQPEKLKVLIGSWSVMNLGLFSYYSKVYVIFSVPPGKLLKLGHDCFPPRFFQFIHNHPIRSWNIVSWYSD